ncbi:MAG TPA: rRNA maturation factor, partial [Selenomonas sp.]|nr:rRNA maturation factor [Selenomonas sp.]
MEILISAEPEEPGFPHELEECVRNAVEKVGELYGTTDAEVSI